MNLKVIAFDADDTLWVNEPYFQAVEHHFCALLEDYLPHHDLAHELFRTEMDNLALYGYGVKGFMLSMVETALRVSNHTIPPEIIAKIIEYGKEMLAQPIELLDGVEAVLASLKGKYKIVLATKGDLLDQQRKLKKSNLAHYFHHIEIMSDKQEGDYQQLIKRLRIKPEQFLMIGNSLKSDVLPVLNIGGYAVHIPYHTTWAHEKVEKSVQHERFFAIEKMEEVLKIV
jgi:putative hydrolase of the HAD superfamily